MKDFCTTPDASQLTADIDNVLQQIEMVLDTRQDEVLGEDYGNDFDQFLFDVNAGNYFVASYVENTIRSNVNLLGWDLSVSVDFLMGDQNDIMIIHILISNNIDIYSKDYKMTEGSISPVY